MSKPSDPNTVSHTTRNFRQSARSERSAHSARNEFRSRAGRANLGLDHPVRKFSIHKVIPLNMVSWRVVADILVARFRFTLPEASRLILSFKHEISHSLNLFLHLDSTLLKSFQPLCLAVNEAHGTDSIEVYFEEKACGVVLRQSIHFRPRRDARQVFVDLSVKQTVCLGRYRCELTNRIHILAFQALLLVVGAIMASLLIGVFLYSLAVLALFSLEPKLVVHAALVHFHLGLALLSILVLIAWSGGRFVRHFLGIKRPGPFDKASHKRI